MIKKILPIVAFICFSSMSHAAPVTYTDRALFEAALDSFTVDSLNGVPAQPSFGADIVRSDYTIINDEIYGCVNLFGCDIPGFNGDDAYLWTYNLNSVGSNEFVFGTPINGFGFDFFQPFGSNPARPILQGLTSPDTSGFYGIIDNVAFSSLFQFQDQTYMAIDNITYGSAGVSPVPVPAAVWLFGTALIGMAGFGKRRKSA